MLRLQTVSKQHPEQLSSGSLQRDRRKIRDTIQIFFFKGIQELCIPQESALEFPWASAHIH